MNQLKAKQNKIFVRRRAFSLLELFIAMTIMAIFASFISANITSQNQTPKSEAEKLAAYLTDLSRKADRRHIGFTIKFEGKGAYCLFGGNKKDIPISSGFKLSSNANTIVYKSNENEFDRICRITVKRTVDNSTYYVHLKQGRARASDDPTDDPEYDN